MPKLALGILLSGTAAACGGSAEDVPDVVIWHGVDYVLEWSCPRVDESLLATEPESATLDPALYGVENVAVRVRPIRGLDPDEVIAVEGSESHVCPDTASAGSGVAYNVKRTGGAEVLRRLDELRVGDS